MGETRQQPEMAMAEFRRWSVSSAAALALCTTGCAIHPDRHFDDTGVRATNVSSQSQNRQPAPSDPRTLAPAEQSQSAPRSVVAVVHSSLDANKDGDNGPLVAPRDKDLEQLPAPKSILTLDEVINTCLIADPKTRAGFEAINQANADALSAALKPNPVLWSDIQLLPLTRPFVVTEQGGPPQLDVQLSYPIDWFVFGKRAAAMASAAMGQRVSEADYANLVRERVTQASLAFYDLIEAKALAEATRKEIIDFEQVGMRSKNAEKKDPNEQRLIDLQLVKSRRQLHDAEAAIQTSKTKLRSLLGPAWGGRDFDVAHSLDALPPLPSTNVDEAVALAVQNRPDLASWRWKLTQAQADIDVERRKAFPTVTPTIGYTRQFQRKAIGFPDADSWMASIEVPLPLFNRNEGGRAKAISAAAQRQYELQAAEIELRGEIESALREARAASGHADVISKEQIRLADDVRNQFSKAYEPGKEGLKDFLDAQKDYHETQRALITSRAAVWRASVKLSAAVGQQAGLTK
jgi:outer membrane protein, heavy metal efflux system